MQYDDVRRKVFDLLNDWSSLSRSALKRELSFCFPDASHELMGVVDMMVEKDEILYQYDSYVGETVYYF